MTRISHLADEICAGAEIYYTGRQGSQYLKTAFILCDDYTELAAKLYLLEHTNNWSDTQENGRFKNFHQVLDDVTAECSDVSDLAESMKERRTRRNQFFHSAQLLDLNLTTRVCVEAYCDLLEFCETLFETHWQSAVEGARELGTLAILFKLERITFSSTRIQREIDEVFESWPRNNTSQKKKGVHLAKFPEDMHLRLSVIDGGARLRERLQLLLDNAAS